MPRGKLGSQPLRQCPKFTKRPDESQQKKKIIIKKYVSKGGKEGQEPEKTLLAAG